MQQQLSSAEKQDTACLCVQNIINILGSLYVVCCVYFRFTYFRHSKAKFTVFGFMLS